MALAIATNNAALNAAASASSVNRDMETSMARLSTGKRINSASDDAAGVAISSRLSAEIRGTDQAIRNSLDGQALIDTAEGAHKEIENILQRMREVSVQAANDTNNSQDRGNLQAEMTAMISEIDRIADTTTWAGTNLMATGTSSFQFQVGANIEGPNQIGVNIQGMTSAELGVGGSAGISEAYFAVSSHTITGTSGKHSSVVLDKVTEADATTDKFKVSLTAVVGASQTTGGFTLELFGETATLTGNTVTDHNEIESKFGKFGVTADIIANDNSLDYSATAQTGTDYLELTVPQFSASSNISLSSANNARLAITDVDDAIYKVNNQRSALGAVSNRLNHTVNNLTNISSNLSAAKGGIEDADFALETTNLAKNQILQQASTAMLAQANASKQNVLSLLQG